MTLPTRCAQPREQPYHWLCVHPSLSSSTSEKSIRIFDFEHFHMFVLGANTTALSLGRLCLIWLVPSSFPQFVAHKFVLFPPFALSTVANVES